MCDFNSFRANGNIEIFANKADSGESARSVPSQLKSALFAFKLSNYAKTLIIGEMETSAIVQGRVCFNPFPHTTNLQQTTLKT